VILKIGVKFEVVFLQKKCINDEISISGIGNILYFLSSYAGMGFTRCEGDVNEITLLLIAERGAARDAYRNELCMLGVRVDCIATPDMVEGALCEIPYNGILIDVPTMIRSESLVKNRVSSIMERFPVLRLLYNGDNGGIRGLAHGGTLRDNKSLSSFVLNECRTFSPRTIRRSRRSDLVLNVLLAPNAEELNDIHERTVTVNVSEQGCFVYSTKRWEDNQNAWIVVNELEDKTPIGLRIHWSRGWGKMTRMPGIGTSFFSITSGQLRQIRHLL